MFRPHPGTTEAVAKGCSCPITSNHFGEGYCVSKSGTGMCFLIDMQCPVHRRILEESNVKKGDVIEHAEQHKHNHPIRSADDIPTDKPIMFVDDNSRILSGIYEGCNETERTHKFRLADQTLCKVKELRIFHP